MKLRNYKNGRGCIVSTQRSRVTRRTVKVVKHNIQTRTVFTKFFGSLHVEASVRDFKTINKYGSLEGYLLSIKTSQLSQEILRLKKKLLKAVADHLKLENVTSLLSYSHRDKSVKSQMLEYVNSLYTTANISA